MNGVASGPRSGGNADPGRWEEATKMPAGPQSWKGHSHRGAGIRAASAGGTDEPKTLERAQVQGCRGKSLKGRRVAEAGKGRNLQRVGPEPHLQRTPARQGLEECRHSLLSPHATTTHAFRDRYHGASQGRPYHAGGTKPIGTSTSASRGATREPSTGARLGHQRKGERSRAAEAMPSGSMPPSGTRQTTSRREGSSRAVVRESRWDPASVPVRTPQHTGEGEGVGGRRHGGGRASRAAPPTQSRELARASPAAPPAVARWGDTAAGSRVPLPPPGMATWGTRGQGTTSIKQS